MTLTLGKQSMTFTTNEIERLKFCLPSFHEGGNIRIPSDEEAERDTEFMKKHYPKQS